jgi:histone deacetylase complex regulatory component SIN3
MKINSFQQNEINSHKDAELQWIIQETINSFTKNKENVTEDRFNIFNFFKAVGVKIAETIADREGFNTVNHMLTEKEAGNYLWNSYKAKYPEMKNIIHKNYDELILPFLDELINSALLRARVPLQIQAEEYWPFGQEGGFCNPNKLT